MSATSNKPFHNPTNQLALRSFNYIFANKRLRYVLHLCAFLLNAMVVCCGSVGALGSVVLLE
jgi:hypothetical protein